MRLLRQWKEGTQSTGETDQKKAEKFLRQKIKEVHASQIGARPFIGPAQERVTINELLDSLQTGFRIEGKDSAQFKSHLKKISSYFGTWKALRVSADEVDKFIQAQLDEGYAKATVNRSTQILGQAFKKAIRDRKLSNAPYIRHLDERDNVRQGFFEDWEFRAVKSHLPEYLADYAHWSYRTGWRKTSIARLKWEHYDGRSVRMPGKNWKNRDAQMVMLDDDLMELIERRKKVRAVKTETGVVLSDLIFHHDGNPIVDYRKAWRTATRLAGCPGKLFHDFCRTAIRNYDRAGVSQSVAMQATGRKTASIYRRYNIVNEKDLLTATEKQQAYIEQKQQEEAKRQPAAAGLVQ